MGSEGRVRLGLSMLALAGLTAVAIAWGPRFQHLWAAPILFAAFLVAYHFDVRVPGLGSMNVDQVVALPSAAVLGSPALAGILAGLALLLSRTLRRGVRGIRSVHAYDSCQVALSVAAGGWLFLALAGEGDDRSPAWLLYLLAGMGATSALNLGAFALERWAVGRPMSPSTLRGYFRTGTLWTALAAPFAGLVVHAARMGDPVALILSALTVLFAVWALRLNTDVEAKNAALLEAQRRQEFLQNLTFATAGSLESDVFLKDLLDGLRTFVRWDRVVLLLHPPESPGEPVLIAPGSPDLDLAAARPTLLGLLEDPSLMRHPKALRHEALAWTLKPTARGQLVALLATSEIAFGVLVAERDAPEPFSPEEVAFLETALAQVARHVQDEILKKQLMASNDQLLRRTGHLSQILHISNLLKIHFEPQAILEHVALGILDGLGFKSVLISLYVPQERCFQRIAQAGLKPEEWEEVRQMRPPEDRILPYLTERFKVGNCYLIRHTEYERSPYDVIPRDVPASEDPTNWHPEDMLLVPLMDRDEKLVGILSVDEPEDSKVPSAATLQALEVLANQTVTALEGAQVHARTKRQATLDGLTGLFNHGHFQETLQAASREHAREGRPYSILMMDLDNFKEINDTYGHITGDAVLRAVAGTLTANLRREDMAARYGGEEFAVLIPDRTATQTYGIAQRICEAVRALDIAAEEGSGRVRVTLSVGLADYPGDAEDHGGVLARADQALYEAKRSGKDRVRTHKEP